MTTTDGVANDLGVYSDWLAEARRSPGGTRPRASLDQLRAALGPALDFGDPGRPSPVVTVDRRWRTEGLRGECLSWDVGYGPPTRALLVRPDTDDALPGIVGLHCHGHHKAHGKEKLVDGPDTLPSGIAAVRDQFYDGRAVAQDLAREGFVVLVHDAFLWGSRGFERATMERALRRDARGGTALAADEAVSHYNALAMEHEHVVAKYCSALGTHLGAVVSHEDRIAVGVLAGREDVVPGGVGVFGFSGGGARAALLLASSTQIRAAVVAGMMSSHRDLLDRHIAPHTWMFFPPMLARIGDWPDLAAAGAPTPLLVQLGQHDPMFTPSGMRAAHEQLTERYAEAGDSAAYVGEFYESGHAFTATMQRRAFTWLGARLR